MIQSKSALQSIDCSSCRRTRQERRQATLHSLACSLFRKRRKRLRRKEDKKRGFYVDWHEPFLFAIVFGILLFCVADAFFTLNILNNGGRELNPFMRIFLEKDSSVFFFVKFFLTSLCLILIVAHKHFRIFGYFNGYHILFGVFSGYILLISYELVILYGQLYMA